jgi:hypothetical protein
MKVVFVFLSLLLVPLGAVAQEPSTTEEVRPCTAVVTGADLAGWKEVRATGFTFCVPASWRPSGRARGGVDARTWRGGGGEVTWGTGTFRSTTTTTTMVTVRAGDPLPAPPAGQSNRFTEVIGGSVADLWDNRVDGKHYTGAKWARPSMYVAGESRDAGTSRIHLQVYRTVRFAQP